MVAMSDGVAAVKKPAKIGLLMTLADAAWYLGLSINTVRVLVDEGKIQAVRVHNGRRPVRESVETFVARNLKAQSLPRVNHQTKYNELRAKTWKKMERENKRLARKAAASEASEGHRTADAVAGDDRAAVNQ